MADPNKQIGGSHSTNTGAMQYIESHSKEIIAISLSVVGVAMVVFACILASGTYGGGVMAFTAGGLVVGSMVLFSIAAYIGFPEPPTNCPWQAVRIPDSPANPT